MITKDKLCEVLEYRKGKLYWKKNTGNKDFSGKVAGSKNHNGYIATVINNKRYFNSHLVWLMHHGYISENLLDHINRKRDDDRIENLREVSRSCNNRNAGLRKDNSSGVKGVSFHNGCEKWHAYINVGGRKRYLGKSDDFYEAVLLRLAAEQCIGWGVCEKGSSAHKYHLARIAA